MEMRNGLERNEVAIGARLKKFAVASRQIWMQYNKRRRPGDAA
jgi:hypothetical protein